MKDKQTQALKRFHRIERLQELRRSFWTKAEQFDGIKPGGAFVIFSDDNPYVRPVERAYSVMIAVRGGYRYVGN